MNTSERIGLLMFRYMRNELSRRENKELLAWRNQSPKHESSFQEATDWENIRIDFQEADKTIDAILEKFRKEYPEHSQKKEVKLIPRFHPLLRVAAVLVLLLSAGYYQYINFQKNTIHPGTYAASIIFPNGSKDDISKGAIQDFIRGFKAGSAGVKVVEHENGEIEYIAKNYPRAARDKSFELLTYRGNAFILQIPNIARIWINASTNIWIPANLSGDTIRIKLTGEAYFDIAAGKHLVIEIPPTANHQPSTINLPSTVNRQPSTIIKESGTFNIHAYPSDSLKVTRDPSSFAWKNRMIFYQDASIKNIMDDISRWYNVDVQYKSNLSDKKYHINLPRSSEFRDVLQVLKDQGAVLFVNGKTIIVI